MYNTKKVILTIFVVLFMSVSLNSLAENNFWITEIKVLDKTNILVEFNKNLDKDSAEFSEFELVDYETSEELEITWLELQNSNSLKLTIWSDLENKEYMLLAVFVTDEDFNLIESWLEWNVVFNVDDSNFYSQENLVETPQEVVVDEMVDITEEVVETNEDITEEAVETPQEVVLEEEDLRSADEVAMEASVLAETWTTETLIILLSLILSLWFFYIRKKA